MSFRVCVCVNYLKNYKTNQKLNLLINVYFLLYVKISHFVITKGKREKEPQKIGNIILYVYSVRE